MSQYDRLAQHPSNCHMLLGSVEDARGASASAADVRLSREASKVLRSPLRSSHSPCHARATEHSTQNSSRA